MALYDIGCFVGACVALWIGEVFGRKKTVLVGTTVMTVDAVVEITPIGIQNLHWKFYIVWTVLNTSFVPLMYL